MPRASTAFLARASLLLLLPPLNAGSGERVAVPVKSSPPTSRSLEYRSMKERSQAKERSQMKERSQAKEISQMKEISQLLGTRDPGEGQRAGCLTVRASSNVMTVGRRRRFTVRENIPFGENIPAGIALQCGKTSEKEKLPSRGETEAGETAGRDSEAETSPSGEGTRAWESIPAGGKRRQERRRGRDSEAETSIESR
ncbi:unnamed protein product [Darwinula stevensoni]|uniref:Uncharacterized protein n=1 Tax=Darwinula stevensoni TaxID=69355 RepID=A0A7R9A9A0_9CRUS|nr:unnamed protein product [Darwinula stevensoni]CAG0897201.1 unnamed protein product [Darwinula stevensoni]